jgi:hypothetical protein
MVCFSCVLQSHNGAPHKCVCVWCVCVCVCVRYKIARLCGIAPCCVIKPPQALLMDTK